MDKMNAGFHIVMEEAYTCEEDRKYGIALGRKTTIYGEEWVTWSFTECADGEHYYFWGHYFTRRLTALMDYHKRLAKEYASVEG